jgi:hypothetical protein
MSTTKTLKTLVLTTNYDYPNRIEFRFTPNHYYPDFKYDVNIYQLITAKYAVGLDSYTIDHTFVRETLGGYYKALSKSDKTKATMASKPKEEAA